MPDINFKAIKKAHIYLRDSLAGTLEKIAEDRFIFQYSTQYLNQKSSVNIAQTLDKRQEPFVSKFLHPFFDNLIAEGWLLQYTEKVFHIDKSNRFALLMATGRSPIGAVTVRPLDSNGEEIDILAEFAPNSSGNFENQNLKLISSTQPDGFPYCTTCFKPLKAKALHRKCVIEMWGTEKPIKIELDAHNPLSTFARVIYGGSISGAQKKGMFKLDPKKGLLQATAIGAQYILKPSGDYPELPENEHVTMAIARALGFSVPPFTLLQIEGMGNVFAIKRFDRSSIGIPLMMEDMGQVVQVPSSDKYDSSHEKIVKAINTYSSAPQIDINDFYHRMVFCYFIANADMHLKNWALLENDKALGTFKLSPCYDLLNTRLPIPGEKSDVGLKLLGRDRNLQASYFIRFGHQIGMSENKIKAVFDEIPKWLETTTDFVNKSLLKKESKIKYLKIVKERAKTLQFGVKPRS